MTARARDHDASPQRSRPDKAVKSFFRNFVTGLQQVCDRAVLEYRFPEAGARRPSTDLHLELASTMHAWEVCVYKISNSALNSRVIYDVGALCPIICCTRCTCTYRIWRCGRPAPMAMLDNSSLGTSKSSVLRHERPSVVMLCCTRVCILINIVLIHGRPSHLSPSHFSKIEYICHDDLDLEHCYRRVDGDRQSQQKISSINRDTGNMSDCLYPPALHWQLTIVIVCCHDELH